MANLIEAGVPTYAVREDLEDRGIGTDELAKGLQFVSRSEVAGLYESHDSIWHW